MRTVSRIALSCTFLLAASAAEAQTQVVVPIQGVLTDANGEPVAATLPMTFSLYANAAATTPFWSETQQVAVGSVFPGVYTVQLGVVTALAAESFRDNPLAQFGVRVGTDTAEIGRWPLGASPRAAHAVLSDAAGSGGFDRATADPLYVNASGDTMSGPLVLPQGGLRVGTNQIVTDAMGRVAIGLTPSTHRLEVTGGSTRLDGRSGAGLHLDLAGTTDLVIREVSGVDDLVQIGSMYHRVSANQLGVGRQPSTAGTNLIKLDVAGPIGIDGGAVISRDATTVSLGDVTAADGTVPNLVLRTNDTTRVTVDGLGLVGIGTAPLAGARLRVAGGNLKIEPGVEAVSDTLALGQNPNGDAVIWIPNFGEAGIQFKSNATGPTGERITFRANGRVGIGTTLPESALDVRGELRALSICFDADCRTSWADATASPWVRRTGETVLVDAADRVGIGTTAPNSALHLYTSANAAADLLRIESDPATPGRQEVGMNFVTDSGGGARLQSARIWSQFAPTGAWDDANLHLGTGSGTPPRVTIKGNGNVGIATVSPAARLHVNGDMIVQGALAVGNDTTACGSARAGWIRWTGAAFEGCDGMAWRSLGEFSSAAGETVNYVSTQTNTPMTLSGTIPWDDTPPLDTEGNPLLAVTITPRRTTSLIVLEGVVHWSEPSNTSDYMTVAIFRDGTPQAIATAVDSASNGNARCTANSGYSQICTLPIRFTVPSGTTSPTTFRLRVGLNAGAVVINQGFDGRKLGGSLYSTFSATEVGGGGAINYEYAQTNAPLTLPGTFPWDDTTPLETEGNSLLGVTITPRSATSLVVLDGTVNWTEPANHSDYMTVAIFRDGNPAAIAAATDAASNGNGRCTANGSYPAICTMPIRFTLPAGTTSPITFRLRVGLNGGAVAINQGFDGRKLGGTLYSTFSATEVGSVGLANYVYSQTNTPMTLPGTIPWDDTAPLETEGNALLSVTITPRNAASSLVLNGTVNWTEPANHSDYMTAAIFRDGTPAAIAAAVDGASNGNGRCTANSTYPQICTMPIQFTVPAGTTSPITFRLRVGLNGGAVAINQGFNGRKLEGTMYSTFSVAELGQ